MELRTRNKAEGEFSPVNSAHLLICNQYRHKLGWRGRGGGGNRSATRHPCMRSYVAQCILFVRGGGVGSTIERGRREIYPAGNRVITV